MKYVFRISCAVASALLIWEALGEPPPSFGWLWIIPAVLFGAVAVLPEQGEER